MNSKEIQTKKYGQEILVLEETLRQYEENLKNEKLLKERYVAHYCEIRINCKNYVLCQNYAVRTTEMSQYP